MFSRIGHLKENPLLLPVLRSQRHPGPHRCRHASRTASPPHPPGPYLTMPCPRPPPPAPAPCAPRPRSLPCPAISPALTEKETFPGRPRPRPQAPALQPHRTGPYSDAGRRRAGSKSRPTINCTMRSGVHFSFCQVAAIPAILQHHHAVRHLLTSASRWEIKTTARPRSRVPAPPQTTAPSPKP